MGEYDFWFFKQKTAYEVRISDWSSDVCSSDVLGTGVPGMQIDRRCGSGLQAVLNAAAQISVGAATLIVAGGAESMSQAEHYALGLRQGIKIGRASGRERVCQYV